MKVGLIDVDGHNYPNLPLMKISAWHKSQGDHVEWYSPLLSGHMDRVYLSKVFSFTPDYTGSIDADDSIRFSDKRLPQRVCLLPCSSKRRALQCESGRSGGILDGTRKNCTV